jgi:hypothetical protein
MAPKGAHGGAYNKFEDEKEDVSPVGSQGGKPKGQGVTFSSNADEVEIDLN